MSLYLRSTVTGVAVIVALCGCQKHDAAPAAASTETTQTTDNTGPRVDETTPQSEEAIAQLSPTQGNTASGTVRFSPTSGGVKITLDVKGLTSGPHGFHVHEVGDCSAPDASSAGGHFNPSGMPHGAPDAERRHAGDFGNIQADTSGNAHSEFIDAHLSMQGENSVIGRAAVVHANPDDLTSQPAGNAGARIACGVIKAGNLP